MPRWNGVTVAVSNIFCRTTVAVISSSLLRLSAQRIHQIIGFPAQNLYILINPTVKCTHSHSILLLLSRITHRTHCFVRRLVLLCVYELEHFNRTTQKHNAAANKTIWRQNHHPNDKKKKKWNKFAQRPCVCFVCPKYRMLHAEPLEFLVSVIFVAHTHTHTHEKVQKHTETW